LVSVATQPMRGGQLFLVVEQQAILAAADQQVQFDAQLGQQPVGALELAHLGRRDQPGLGQCLPVVADAGRARHPLDHLQVAEPPGLSLQLGSRL
jgi:hypothetical protein